MPTRSGPGTFTVEIGKYGRPDFFRDVVGRGTGFANGDAHAEGQRRGTFDTVSIDGLPGQTGILIRHLRIPGSAASCVFFAVDGFRDIVIFSTNHGYPYAVSGYGDAPFLPWFAGGVFQYQRIQHAIQIGDGTVQRIDAAARIGRHAVIAAVLKGGLESPARSL